MGDQGGSSTRGEGTIFFVDLEVSSGGYVGVRLALFGHRSYR